LQRKKALSYAATTVEADNAIYNTAAIDKNLQGKVAGLSISGANDKIIIRGAASTSAPLNTLCIVDGVPMSMEQIKDIPSADILNVEVLKDTKATALYGEKGKNGVIIITTKKALEAITQVKARTNLSETAFFYPHLQSDAKGKVQFSFTSPEALTAWKLRLMAHNKEAVSGFLEKTVVTQKELMVTPNLPRFFREKDSITITAKIANITKDPKVGIAIFQLYDATNMQPVDLKMATNKPTKNFTIAPFGNTTVSWKIYIPEGLQGVQYKILAKAGDFSDGEENIVPVLTNNMLVTESIPVWVKDNSKKEYTFTNLKNNSSSTLKNHQFTFEYTSNPTWLAIQSLPYLMEYEHECAEQTFARFYANALATNIINSNPKIAQVFDNWRQKGTKNSPLESNETLKSIILAETPWLRDATSEEEKKQRLATLFDLEKMKSSQEATFDKLKQKQKSSGGFAWFDGSDANEYITRHIIAGLGHLQKLSSDEKTTASISTITKTAVPYLDQQFLQSHDKSAANNSTLIWRNPYTELHYLYSRSFFLKANPTSDALNKTINKYLDAVKKEWLTYSLYEKGLAALTLNRFGEQESAKKIVESLKETASNNEDWGMYWIANKSGWYWYQAPIETQALLIEAFTEVTNDKKSVDNMKVCLLKNKQTKNWPTTKSTTEAIYALLMQGTDWLSVKDNTVIKIGDEKILTKKRSQTEKEAETGYLKLTWKAAEIKKEMANISIQNKSNVPGYGGIYWQYFEDLDQIKSSDNQNLTVLKELYLNKDTANGKQLNKITAANPLQIGDLVTVRLVINAKEPMEFVHLKDMRASCFEPTDVLSTYQYKGGLGFYQSTKDAATHFFFDKIEKGTYVLEYTVRVNNKGDFSNGISTIQSMYAPEYSSHTKGIRVTVKE
jgi:TonB-dependent SusC/RagA subfamily outer membrane receptor